MYSYRKAVKEDVREWIEDNNAELDYDTIYEGCWIDDSVTGNGSGSYTFNRNGARTNFFRDLDSEDYIYNMCEEGFTTTEEVGKHIVNGDWEWIDVIIRCYLLGEVVQDVIDEME